MKENFYSLSNNYKIPNIGFGTFRTPSGEETEQSVLNAIKAGYRHIDCAAAYGNEKVLVKPYVNPYVNPV